jgi:hypothetical protein
MATARQLELEQAFRQALKELGTGVSTEFLMAISVPIFVDIANLIAIFF